MSEALKDTKQMYHDKPKTKYRKTSDVSGYRMQRCRQPQVHSIQRCAT